MQFFSLWIYVQNLNALRLIYSILYEFLFPPNRTKKPRSGEKSRASLNHKKHLRRAVYSASSHSFQFFPPYRKADVPGARIPNTLRFSYKGTWFLYAHPIRGTKTLLLIIQMNLSQKRWIHLYLDVKRNLHEMI